MCKSCPPEGTCGEFFSPNLPQGFLTWNIITSLPYGLIYILLQVKLIRLRNMLKIPQSILSTVKTLVISCLPVWLWMTLCLFRDLRCQLTTEKQNQASSALPGLQKILYILSHDILFREWQIHQRTMELKNLWDVLTCHNTSVGFRFPRRKRACISVV